MSASLVGSEDVYKRQRPSTAVPTTAAGALARTPPTMMASPALLLGSVRGSPWPSSGQPGSACAASAWR
eukprot:11810996-Alexandrium_andersonii.AAC.1